MGTIIIARTNSKEVDKRGTSARYMLLPLDDAEKQQRTLIEEEVV